MFRTIIWFIYFWLYLIKVMPAYFKTNRLLKEGNIKERDEYVSYLAFKWANDLLKLAGTKVNVVGAENVPKDRAVLFVGNHQGNFDTPLFLGCIDKPKAFVAKIETQKLPIIRTWMKHMHCVFMDRDDMRQSLRVMNEAAEYLKAGYSMVIFPEGTRSKGRQMADFKAGSLKIAIKAGVPIVPVTIDGSYKIMEQNKNLIKPAVVDMIISEPIETANLTKEETAELNNRVYSIIKSKIPER